MKAIMMKLVLNAKLPSCEIKQKLDQVYYYYNCVDLNIELE